MYCPRCGQPAREDVKFCSHCGFPLNPVHELIASGGVITPRDQAAAKKKEVSERRKGIRRGAKILFFSLVVFLVAFGLAVASDSPEFLIIPFTMFLAGVLWMLYYRLFGDDTPLATEHPLLIQPGATPPRPALPPQYENAVSSYYAPARNTADMMEQPSVTETTTKLLEDN